MVYYVHYTKVVFVLHFKILIKCLSQWTRSRNLYCG